MKQTILLTRVLLFVCLSALTFNQSFAEHPANGTKTNATIPGEAIHKIFSIKIAPNNLSVTVSPITGGMLKFTVRNAQGPVRASLYNSRGIEVAGQDFGTVGPIANLQLLIKNGAPGASYTLSVTAGRESVSVTCR